MPKLRVIREGLQRYKMSDSTSKEIRPQPGRQQEFLESFADIAIYGGAAGGG
jgi:hypothetical protein